MRPVSELAPGLRAHSLEFDPRLLDPLRRSWGSVVEPGLDPRWLSGGRVLGEELEAGGDRFWITSFGSLPLLWVSSDDLPTYLKFREFFHALGIEAQVRQLVDCREAVEVYCGFFVVGDRAEPGSWHVDYGFGANGLTLLTPLFEPDPGHGGLLYYDAASEVRRYEYRLGEAILFGSGFYHATEAYERTAAPRVLLSLTLGTDRMKHWPRLEPTVGRQSRFLVLPCGHERGSWDHLPPPDVAGP